MQERGCIRDAEREKESERDRWRSGETARGRERVKEISGEKVHVHTREVQKVLVRWTDAAWRWSNDAL